MMKKLGIVAGLLVMLLAVPLVAVLLLNRYLQSPEFKDLVLSRVQDAIGAEASVGEMDVSIFRGVSLSEVRISNPPHFDGEFLTADNLLFRHQLVPLLSRRVEIDRLVVAKPVVRLLQADSEAWNFELFRSGAEEKESPSAELESDEPAVDSFDIALSEFSVRDGELAMQGRGGRLLAQAEDIDLTSSVSLIQGDLRVEGELSLNRLNIGDALFVHGLVAPVAMSAAGTSLTPITAQLAGGEFSGDITLETAAGLRYLLNVTLRKADVARLIEEAGIESKAKISGRLQATARVEGTGGLPTMVGKGRAEVVSGKLGGVPALSILATLLQVPALQEIDFEECLIEFNLADNVVETPVIRLISPLIQLTGQGSLSLQDNTLDHHMTLVGKPELLASVPQSILRVFDRREDGSHALDFRVWGPYDSPQTDLAQRLLGGATRDLIRRGLRSLFGN